MTSSKAETSKNQIGANPENAGMKIFPLR